MSGDGRSDVVVEKTDFGAPLESIFSGIRWHGLSSKDRRALRDAQLRIGASVYLAQMAVPIDPCGFHRITINGAHARQNKYVVSVNKAKLIPRANARFAVSTNPLFRPKNISTELGTRSISSHFRDKAITFRNFSRSAETPQSVKPICMHSGPARAVLSCSRR